MQYLLLIYGNEAEAAKMGEAGRTAMFNEYRTFTESIIQGGQFKGGNAMQSTATATTARKAAKSNWASTVNGALTNSLRLMLAKSQHPYAGSGSSPQGLVASITSQ